MKKLEYPKEFFIYMFFLFSFMLLSYVSIYEFFKTTEGFKPWLTLCVALFLSDFFAKKIIKYLRRRTKSDS